MHLLSPVKNHCTLGDTEGTHDPLHVNFNLLMSCEQNLVIFCAGQCPHGIGIKSVGSPVRVYPWRGSVRFCPLCRLCVFGKAENGFLLTLH